MKNFDNIENEVEKTLNSLEGINQAEPKAFFYTRLHARMEKELLEPKVFLGFQFKPIYAYSTLAVILLLNIFTILNLTKPDAPRQANEPNYCLYDANGI
jgi:hypothetical protein